LRFAISDLKDIGLNPQSQIANQKSEIFELAVTDTGAGIRAADLSKLFTEFTQLETTAAQAHEGTGLGLALTKRLVALHGGTITAASDGEGQGSTFTVRLPFGGSA
jgi:signal transduction histidine kinase